MFDDLSVYEAWAPTYEKVFGIGCESAKAFTQDYARVLLGRDWIASHHGQPALDMASSIGLFTDALCRLGFDAEGIDLCPAMVAEANRLEPHLKFMVGDVLEHDFADKQYALIYLSASLLYVFEGADKKQAFFDKVASLLMPGGKVFFRLAIVDDLITKGYMAPWLHFSRNIDGVGTVLDVYDYWKDEQGNYGTNYTVMYNHREMENYQGVMHPCLVEEVSPMLAASGLIDIKMKRSPEQAYNMRRQWWCATRPE